MYISQIVFTSSLACALQQAHRTAVFHIFGYHAVGTDLRAHSLGHAYATSTTIDYETIPQSGRKSSMARFLLFVMLSNFAVLNAVDFLFLESRCLKVSHPCSSQPQAKSQEHL